ncbi:alpha-L-arabinofuranosidase [Tamlana nanhaiensis]|uniref:non-reducing end alpha-L-arabinofuranosidase n=1 Tax=Neotamlana nanhaiensis TaxID=1382798 RepID=A0A0D7W5W7_9FLAO|nr:alpha-L-arabinofuranosidase C-terminal domain-containing protein [Tamlana nanhaiensis]KJD34414.1 alpha-L-arabinofuranosidase [Tamlana nanhaiensis]
MKPTKPITLIAVLLFQSLLLVAQDARLQIDLTKNVNEIQPTMYGIFFEDINFAADGGLYAEMVKNRSFEFTIAPFMGWHQPKTNRYSLNEKSGMASVVKHKEGSGNKNFCRVTINDASGYELINEGFRGMGIKENAVYNVYLSALNKSGNISEITLQLITKNGDVLGETKIETSSANWKDYQAQITVSKTEEEAQLKLTFKGTGVIDLDMISMFPVDTWKGREKGLRKDLVQLLYDLKPGFLRFPGGCVVEGRTLERRYQWKKTVGDVEDRELLVNRWNTEFSHKAAPDYYQSFGIGFYEYFQLSEDLGAEPLPILGCGMACQFNTGELAPLEELDPYVQDAIDLIEFANGDATTTWGKLRTDMGHPEPFNLKYVGIGNEQWGPDYIDRYKIFAEKIKAQHPEIIIVSGSGPFPDGEQFEYGWKELKKLDAEIVDEHYYRPPQWFLENAGRYDDYDRNGPKVFAGEYAAHPKGVSDGNTENNWEAALSEAAFMTGLERNADVVVMTSYAPLMAHINAFQWAPDMIWFNNLESYGTANYQVQKLYSNNAGTHTVSLTQNGKNVIGSDGLYASAVKDVSTKTLIIKIANTSKSNKSLSFSVNGASLKRNATITTIENTDLKAYNDFDNPEKVSPKSSNIKVKRKAINVQIPQQSFSVVKIKI